ncbi:MAG: L,D-transpeptidase family protein, partial [Longimicrobiales bacterium]
PAVIAPRPVVARRGVSVEAFAPLARGVSAAWRAMASDRLALSSTTSASDAANALAVVEAVTAPARASTALSFKERQLTLPRVRLAYRRAGAVIDSVLAAHQMLDRVELHIRVYKQDRVVELWGRRSSSLPFVKLREYQICEISGRPGPKRREGDTQVPEGFYTIDALNATSSYHLSLHIDYPNAADRRRPDRARNLGGQIFIHGGCASIGCIAITDRNIEELYAFIVEARDSGQRRIPTAIFPIRMDGEGVAWLSGSYGTDSPDYPFWMNLKKEYDYFERTRRLPAIDVTSTGVYQFGPLSTS